jgi:hypothetical protein
VGFKVCVVKDTANEGALLQACGGWLMQGPMRLVSSITPGMARPIAPTVSII